MFCRVVEIFRRMWKARVGTLEWESTGRESDCRGGGVQKLLKTLTGNFCLHLLVVRGTWACWGPSKGTRGLTAWAPNTWSRRDRPPHSVLRRLPLHMCNYCTLEKFRHETQRELLRKINSSLEKTKTQKKKSVHCYIWTPTVTKLICKYI